MKADHTKDAHITLCMTPEEAKAVAAACSIASQDLGSDPNDPQTKVWAKLLTEAKHELKAALVSLRFAKADAMPTLF